MFIKLCYIIRGYTGSGRQMRDDFSSGPGQIMQMGSDFLQRAGPVKEK